MKKTSKEFMEWLGLQIGDRIKLRGRYYTIEINELSGLPVYANNKRYYNMIGLINQDIEILPRPKRVGDLKCDKECNNCPLRALESCNMFGRLTLYELLEKVYNDWENKDQEIYDLLKARLDKEVE